jgi:hypothetical protein
LIYYVQHLEDKSIKIGTASSVARRIKQLENEYGPLRLLGVHAGGRWTELCMHYRFDHLRQGRTEWFDPGLKLLGYIKEHCHAWTWKDEDDEDYDREHVIVFQGEFLQWTKCFRDHLGISSISPIVENAIANYAKSKGFDALCPIENEGRTRDHPPLDGEPMPVDSVIATCEAPGSEWDWI